MLEDVFPRSLCFNNDRLRAAAVGLRYAPPDHYVVWFSAQIDAPSSLLRVLGSGEVKGCSESWGTRWLRRDPRLWCLPGRCGAVGSLALIPKLLR